MPDKYLNSPEESRDMWDALRILAKRVEVIDERQLTGILSASAYTFICGIVTGAMVALAVVG